MSTFEDERRRQLIEALRRAGGIGGGRVMGSLGAKPLFGGFGRSTHSSMDFPQAALPALSFNPFLAQLQRGVPGLQGPTRGFDRITGTSGGSVSDMTGTTDAMTSPITDSFAGQAQAEQALIPNTGSDARRQLVGVNSNPAGQLLPAELAKRLLGITYAV